MTHLSSGSSHRPLSTTSLPVANDDVATTNEDTIRIIDVLANDSDDNGPTGFYNARTVDVRDLLDAATDVNCNVDKKAAMQALVLSY